jgi:hypothetical protein
MKRKNYRYRALPFPAPSVRPAANRQPDPAHRASANGQRYLRPRNIFVIRQARWLSAGKKIRRVLIFDNHPDSLRLVLGDDANPHVDLAQRQARSPWELVVASILTMTVLIGMFWPLF